jgi:tryptophan synthase alpha chain
MNRYETTFTHLREKNQIAFIPFAVAGDPDIETSEAVFRTYIDSGADILEIGYPFSDPIADGPVNQRGSQRAIAAGLTHAKFFSLIRRLRAWSDIPIGILLYANTIHHLGYDRFCARAAESGIDSLLVADMPPAEAGEALDAMKRYGIRSVFIVSELTSAARMKAICKNVTGFVYVVSRLGTTGKSSRMSGSAADTIHSLRAVTTRPLCVGFGLSKPSHVRAVKTAGAQGAIVGSALVQCIENNRKNKRKMLSELAAMVKQFKKATT